MVTFKHRDLKINNNNKIYIYIFDIFFSLKTRSVQVKSGGICKNHLYFSGEKFPKPYSKVEVDVRAKKTRSSSKVSNMIYIFYALFPLT